MVILTIYCRYFANSSGGGFISRKIKLPLSQFTCKFLLVILWFSFFFFFNILNYWIVVGLAGNSVIKIHSYPYKTRQNTCFLMHASYRKLYTQNWKCMFNLTFHSNAFPKIWVCAYNLTFTSLVLLSCIIIRSWFVMTWIDIVFVLNQKFCFQPQEVG